MLYLKYRPQTIEQLDNVRIKETLGKALLGNEWAHAYLLIGTRGSGKTTTARLIAKIVNCTGRKKGEEPCNECESCVAITEGRSLDVIEIDAASNTGVEDIRELRERVKLAPVSSKYKVYIIDEVHMLSNSAFNALLKTLEEPPEHVIFVLATTDPQKLPPTVVSRCLVYDFGKASRPEVAKSLERKIKQEKIEVEKGVLEAIAQKADGSFRDADKLLEQLAMQSRKLTLEMVQTMSGSDKSGTAAREIMEYLVQKDGHGALLTVEKFAADNGQIRVLLLELITTLKGLLLLRSGIVGEVEDLPLNSEEIKKLLGLLLEANALVRESPVPQLPLEMVVVEYCGQTNTGELITNANNFKEEKKIGDSEKAVPKNTEVESVAPSKKPVSDGNVELEKIVEKWGEILNGVKPKNNSLVALLRSTKLKELKGNLLVIEAFYKFHMDKLSEIKNRELLESVISGIIGVEIKVKFELAQVKT